MSYANFENIPADLRNLSQWVCWKLETVDGRQTKIPYTATGSKANSTDPQSWGTFESCRDAHLTNNFSGIGFVFAVDGKFTGIDLDKRRDPATGELDAFATKYVSRLNTYTEVSQSGTGVHMIARATVPGDKGRRNAKNGVEMYSKARFFVMTGKHVEGTPHTVESRQQAVEGMFREIFPPKEKATVNKFAPDHTLTLTDQDLLNKASHAKNGAQFFALWRGDFAAAGHASQSEADAALLSALYFWTGGDKDRSFSLFSQSGLNRDKWQRGDYRESTWQLVAHGDNHSPQSHKSNEPTWTPPAAHDPLPGNDDPPEQTTPQPPQAKRLSELKRRTADDPSELLRTGYLCRGGGLLLAGPTGIGKSSFAIQCMILWALGRPAFGITPTRPLKSLLVQAENDEGDLAEMRDGVIAGLNLTEEEQQMAMANVIVAQENTRTGRNFMDNAVAPLLELHRPDLLWVDPALAYIGSDAMAQKDVSYFLRNLLNPLLSRFNCGGVVIHHTNKPGKGEEKSTWQAGDFAYLGSGSAEWANWARAVLAIRSVGSHEVFELRAGKRGGRIGWKDGEGKTSFARLIGHATKPGVICWRTANEDETPADKPRRAGTREDLTALVPLIKPIAKNLLIDQWRDRYGNHQKGRAFLDALIADGKLFEWRLKRAGTNAEKLIARKQQPVE